MTPADHITYMIAARLTQPTPPTPEQLRKIVTETLTDYYPGIHAADVTTALAVQLIAERTSRDVPSEWAWLEISHMHGRLQTLLQRREERRSEARDQMPKVDQ